VYLATIAYKMDEKRLQKLYEIIQRVFKDSLYALSPPYIFGRFITENPPKEGVLYAYLKKSKTSNLDQGTTLKVESLFDLKKFLEDIIKRKTSGRALYKAKIITPMIVSPIALYMGEEITLPPGPYPDVISALITFLRDLGAREYEDIVASGLVRLSGYNNLRTRRIDGKEVGVVGEIFVEFLDEAIPLGRFLDGLPFIPLGEGKERGLGTIVFSEKSSL